MDLSGILCALLVLFPTYLPAASPYVAAGTAKPPGDVWPRQQYDWAQVDHILGRTTTTQPDGVRRYSFPRSDLNVTLHGTPLQAGFALGGYAAFKLSETTGNAAAATAIAVGDLVLTDDEVNPVMVALQRGGIQTTAIHNHLLAETPPVMYLHFKARGGDPRAVAQTLRVALSLTKMPPAPAPAPNPATPTSSATTTTQPSLPFSTAALDSAMGGYRGKNNNGVYQYSIPRAEAVRDSDGGVVLPASMGVGTVVNFQTAAAAAAAGGKGTTSTVVAMTGDFSLTAPEVPPVLRVLGGRGIQVEALHSHMLTDEPRLFYVHFWAVGDAVELGRAVREALARTNSAKPT